MRLGGSQLVWMLWSRDKCFTARNSGRPAHGYIDCTISVPYWQYMQNLVKTLKGRDHLGDLKYSARMGAWCHIHNFRGWCCHLVKTLGLRATITLEVIPFRTYVPFPSLLPFFKCILEVAFWKGVEWYWLRFNYLCNQWTQIIMLYCGIIFLEHSW
jgi:hypothetical protein